MQVTPVLRSEREQLFKLVVDYWREYSLHLSFANDAAARARCFDDEFWAEKTFRYLWWARLNAMTIGFAKTELVEDPMWETQGDISEFYVAPSFRRRGHGTAFFRWLLRWFAERGVASVRLFVRVDNPVALAFWQNEGFETVQMWHKMRKALP